MSKLVELDIRKYIDTLASKAPAPGGGSASALSGCQGIALVMMVAELTIGKERYAEYEEICQKAIKNGEKVKKDFLKAIDDDTEAYNKVGEAFKLPKETREEKSIRSKAIQEATILATKVPLETMKIAMKGLNIAQELIGKSNPNCVSDIGVGALNLKTALLGAWLNVKINLPGIKDEEVKSTLAGEAEAMVAQGEKIADQCYKSVEENL